MKWEGLAGTPEGDASSEGAASFFEFKRTQAAAREARAAAAAAAEQSQRGDALREGSRRLEASHGAAAQAAALG